MRGAGVGIEVVRVDLERHQPEGHRRWGDRRSGMSFVVRMLGVATFVPALEPMYGTPLAHALADRVDEVQLVEPLQAAGTCSRRR